MFKLVSNAKKNKKLCVSHHTPLSLLQLPGVLWLTACLKPEQTSTWSSFLWAWWAARGCSASSTTPSSSCWSSWKAPLTADSTASASTAAMTSRRSCLSTRAAAHEQKSTHGADTISAFKSTWILLTDASIDPYVVSLPSLCFSRKATFDMFNFLASQHRALPDLIGPFEEDDDEFPFKASRLVTEIITTCLFYLEPA